MPFTTKEENVRQGDYVHLRHYWNLDKDLYILFANGIPVRKHPIISTID